MSPAASPPAVQRVPIGRLLSDSSRELLEAAGRRAGEDGSDLDTVHVLWAATRVGAARRFLARAGADPDRLADDLAGALPTGTRSGDPALTPATKRVLLAAHARSQAGRASYIGPEHILAALLDEPRSSAGAALRSECAVPGALRESAGGRWTPAGGEPSTPTLDAYGRDLTDEARGGRLDPVVGRAEEIERTVEILSRRGKNNPLLMGDPGVGKTAIVEGLAQRIVAGDVPRALANRRVVALDMAGLAAGWRHPGDFEERLTKVIEEVAAAEKSVVLFIDDAHTVMGARNDAGNGAANGAGSILERALAQGDLSLIGATTVDEYRGSIEWDAALERRFQPVMVREPTVDETVEILRGLRDCYEAHHQVGITDEAVDAAATLSDRYVRDRFLPDKAIDVIDQTCARVALRDGGGSREATALQDRLTRLTREKDAAVGNEDFERAAEFTLRIRETEERLADLGEEPAEVPLVTEDDIASVLSSRTGIPVARLTQTERERLMRLEEALRRRVIGQEEAVTAVARAVRRGRAGMGDPGRPTGSFLFVGPAGVGKTELARALAELLCGEEDRLVRLDMGAYRERHSVARLIGSPPGPGGPGEAGRLTEAVRRAPYGVVLFDEVERAHPEVFDVLLLVLGEGRLTDARGRTADFRNAVVIMTSTIASDRVPERGGAVEAFRDDVLGGLRSRFGPEFLDVIDETVVFHGLGHEDLIRIVDLPLERSRRRLHAQQVDLEVTDTAREWLADRGHRAGSEAGSQAGSGAGSGAGPLRRTIQSELDNRLADMLLDGTVNPGDTAVCDVKDGRLSCYVKGGGGDGSGGSGGSHDARRAAAGS
ncbi:ATP-dependent Clp protease ATP-binding subunit [Streptomyces sp. PT12]|uniref:ATP-dependent Clp protease ATP-binding subunit n=1 Tax=Streptomyces sp. PT12 TaxID=1510197 RepID=UPI000DE2DDAF|nr:ATP-dependent Clp protease ATP-binding subunit [Streptomyces sp. PT12]RBM18714.1 Clp protease [Streptomyces sp. PT12]